VVLEAAQEAAQEERREVAVVYLHSRDQEAAPGEAPGEASGEAAS